MAVLITHTCALPLYGLEKVICSFSSSVMVMPFQMQSMDLLFSSTTFWSQSISTNSGVRPSFSHTASASSVSKPVRLPLSSL